MLNIKLHHFKHGKNKVLFIYNCLNDQKSYESIAKYNNLDLYFLELLDPTLKDYYAFLSVIKKETIDEYYNSYYEYIYNLVINKKINLIVIFATGYPYSEKFLSTLKKLAFVVSYFADDPEGSFYTSKHWVKYYDIAFCGGIYFNKYKKISEKYIEFGAKESYFIPLGVYKNKYIPVPVDFKNRNNLIVFIGSNTIKRFFRIFILKLIYRNKLIIYGYNWNYREAMHPIKKIVMFMLYPIFKNSKKINSNEELIKIYRNTKIGINLHLSYGPSNTRSYELPINGVMEIADNPKGFSELYELDKEIICCDNIFQMIKKINYYLKHDDERIKIAKAGYKKTKQNYLIEYVFKKMFDIIYNNDQYKKRMLLKK